MKALETYTRLLRLQLYLLFLSSAHWRRAKLSRRHLLLRVLIEMSVIYILGESRFELTLMYMLRTVLIFLRLIYKDRLHFLDCIHNLLKNQLNFTQ